MKPEVERKVCDALAQLWEPIAKTIGLQEIVINDIDDRKRLVEETLHFDNELWFHLVKVLENELGSIAKVWSTSQEIRISLDDVKHFSITIDRISYEEDDEFDFSELEGMSREEAIEYLTELEDIPSFDYAEIEIIVQYDCGYHSIRRLIGNQGPVENFLGIVFPIVKGLHKTQEVYNDAIKAASIELQKTADKQREIDNKMKAKKEEKTRILLDFASKVEPILIDAGWSGKYRVSMNFNNYVLSLQLTSYDECRYESITQSDVIDKIGELVSFANAYRTLKIAGGLPILHGEQVRAAEWRKIIDR